METLASIAVYIFHFSSYPTYEEWKLQDLVASFYAHTSSYPTYEEWKHENVSYFYKGGEEFLSYLWGMETKHKRKKRSSNTTFLSYLWGMETGSVLLRGILPLRSYPTYEEWKPPLDSGISAIWASKFLSYLWGMETW